MSSSNLILAARTKNQKELIMDDRTTTDAVHERLRAVYYNCTTCGMKFRASDIRLHYREVKNPSHKTEEKCSYCKQPVYRYQTETGEDKVWHKCPER